MRYTKIMSIILGSLFIIAGFNSISYAKKETKEAVQLEIKSFDWQGKIPESRLVIIKNPYGSIRSRNNSEKKVFLHATYQLIGDSPLQPEFKISEKGEHLQIEVEYTGSIYDSKKQLRGRTDLSVLFPADVSIYAETNQGLIKIDKTASHVEAITKSGDIKLTTTGLFAVRTDSGKIDLRLRGQKQSGTSSAISKSGDIKADIFDDMDLNLTASSNDKIILNDVEHQNTHTLVQGSEQSRISFRSSSGKIFLNIIKPPELIQSVKPSNVHVVNVDLRDLKKAKQWKPGDPIIERSDKRDNSNSN